MPEEKIDTLLSTGQIPIIDLAHCGELINFYIYNYICSSGIMHIVVVVGIVNVMDQWNFLKVLYDQRSHVANFYCYL